MLGFVALAAPRGLVSEAVLPTLFILGHKGLGTAELVTTSVLAPILSLPSLASMRTRVGTLGAAVFVAAVTAASIALGFIAANLGFEIRPAHKLLSHEHSAVQWVCAGVVALFLGGGLVWFGPWVWFSPSARRAEASDAD